jgi:hypothetical protein
MTFRINQRVRIMPHSDVFMMGELYGCVVSVGRKWVTVQGERSRRKFKFAINGDSLEAA